MRKQQAAPQAVPPGSEKHDDKGKASAWKNLDKPFPWKIGKPDFKPRGGVAAYATEQERDEKIHEALVEEAILHEYGRLSDPLDSRDLAAPLRGAVQKSRLKEIADTALRRFKEKQHKEYEECFKRWLVGKSPLNDKAVTPYGYRTWTEQMPRATRWVLAQQQMTDVVRKFLFSLYIKGPREEKELEWYFRYLVWPVDLARRRLEKHRNAKLKSWDELRGCSDGSYDFDEQKLKKPDKTGVSGAAWPRDLTYGGLAPAFDRKLPLALDPCINPYMREKWVRALSYNEWIQGDFSKKLGDLRDIWEVAQDRIGGRDDAMVQPGTLGDQTENFTFDASKEKGNPVNKSCKPGTLLSETSDDYKAAQQFAMDHSHRPPPPAPPPPPPTRQPPPPPPTQQPPPPPTRQPPPTPDPNGDTPPGSPERQQQQEQMRLQQEEQYNRILQTAELNATQQTAILQALRELPQVLQSATREAIAHVAADTAGSFAAAAELANDRLAETLVRDVGAAVNGGAEDRERIARSLIEQLRNAVAGLSKAVDRRPPEPEGGGGGADGGRPPGPPPPGSGGVAVQQVVESPEGVVVSETFQELCRTMHELNNTLLSMQKTETDRAAAERREKYFQQIAGSSEKASRGVDALATKLDEMKESQNRLFAQSGAAIENSVQLSRGIAESVMKVVTRPDGSGRQELAAALVQLKNQIAAGSASAGSAAEMMQSVKAILEQESRRSSERVEAAKQQAAALSKQLEESNALTQTLKQQSAEDRAAFTQTVQELRSALVAERAAADAAMEKYNADFAARLSEILTASDARLGAVVSGLSESGLQNMQQFEQMLKNMEQSKIAFTAEQSDRLDKALTGIGEKMAALQGETRQRLDMVMASPGSDLKELMAYISTSQGEILAAATQQQLGWLSELMSSHRADLATIARQNEAIADSIQQVIQNEKFLQIASAEQKQALQWVLENISEPEPAQLPPAQSRLALEGAGPQQALPAPVAQQQQMLPAGGESIPAITESAEAQSTHEERIPWKPSSAPVASPEAVRNAITSQMMTGQKDVLKSEKQAQAVEQLRQILPGKGPEALLQLRGIVDDIGHGVSKTRAERMEQLEAAGFDPKILQTVRSLRGYEAKLATMLDHLAESSIAATMTGQRSAPDPDDDSHVMQMNARNVAVNGYSVASNKDALLQIIADRGREHFDTDELKKRMTAAGVTIGSGSGVQFKEFVANMDYLKGREANLIVELLKADREEQDSNYGSDDEAADGTETPEAGGGMVDDGENKRTERSNGAEISEDEIKALASESMRPDYPSVDEEKFAEKVAERMDYDPKEENYKLFVVNLKSQLSDQSQKIDSAQLSKMVTAVASQFPASGASTGTTAKRLRPAVEASGRQLIV